MLPHTWDEILLKLSDSRVHSPVATTSPYSFKEDSSKLAVDLCEGNNHPSDLSIGTRYDYCT